MYCRASTSYSYRDKAKRPKVKAKQEVVQNTLFLYVFVILQQTFFFLTGMSDRVVDESNPDNYLSTKDVHSLWAEEDLLKEIPIDPWDIQGCVQKCNKLGDVVRILIKFLLLFYSNLW